MRALDYFTSEATQFSEAKATFRFGYEALAERFAQLMGTSHMGIHLRGWLAAALPA
jgi:hypothetical protein